MTIKNAIIFTLFFIIGIAHVNATDWTLYRGDTGATGRAAETITIGDKLKIVWEERLEKGFFEASPIVFGDSIFVASSEAGMQAFDLKTGKPKWTFKTEKRDLAASAAYFEGLVFVGDVFGTLHALDAKTGERKWFFETKGTIDNSPNIDAQTKRVIIGSQAGTIFALEAATGAKVWEYETDDQIQCFPSILGRHCFVAGCDSYLHVINLDTGKRVHYISLESPTGATPLVTDDFAFVGTEGNEFLAIDWKQEKVLWRFEMRQGARAPAAYRDGIIVFGGMDRVVYALDAKTGEERWKFTTRGRIEGGAVIVGNKVYIPSNDSSLYVLDLKSGTRIESKELAGKLLTSPAVVANRIILATDDGVLTCLQGE